MSNQRYSPEFRDEAVRQILEGGHSTSEVATRNRLPVPGLSGSAPLLLGFVCIVGGLKNYREFWYCARREYRRQ